MLFLMYQQLTHSFPQRGRQNSQVKGTFLGLEQSQHDSGMFLMCYCSSPSRQTSILQDRCHALPTDPYGEGARLGDHKNLRSACPQVAAIRR